MEKIRVNRAEALRYLGVRGEADSATARELARAAELVEQALQPRCCALRAPLERGGGALRVQGTVLCLPGKDIAELLRNCAECILFCATLGAGVEQLLRSWQLRDLAFAAMLDACASSAVEALCDAYERELALQPQQEGLFLTDRFSPGYGDLPLSLQKDFCAVLDTARRIGVSLTASGILLPRKSVTAVIGLSPRPEARREGCARCPNAGRCTYRKEGTSCAV